jgi:CRISPR-associated protein Cst2
MAFITGYLLIDAPASALNNSGEAIQGARTENTSSVKYIRAQDGKTYPYVSGQAIRYWIRNSLELDNEWKSSQTYRADKIAFSDANPLLYWDDDLFGYMRAPSKNDQKKMKESQASLNMTPLEEDEKGNPKPVTRASPFRVGTLVSVGPVNLTQDFGTMSRQDGDPVPYEHQFYRTQLQTLFALDLNMVGKFTYLRRSGFQNLDSIRRQIAVDRNLTHLPEEHAYVLSNDERAKRVSSLMVALGRMQGGAKQAVHYTDVSPAVAIFAMTRGGNNPFNYIFQHAQTREYAGEIRFNVETLTESIYDSWRHGQLLTHVYVGWKPGFMPEARAQLPTQVGDVNLIVDSPQAVFTALGKYIVDNPGVMDHGR